MGYWAPRAIQTELRPTWVYHSISTGRALRGALRLVRRGYRSGKVVWSCGHNHYDQPWFVRPETEALVCAHEALSLFWATENQLPNSVRVSNE